MSDPGLYDRPVLALDPGMHTAPIRRADVDRAGRVAVTASHDKTVRVWSLADGALLDTIRLPAGPGDVGKAYAVAISPDGGTIATGGWTTDTATDNIYLFDRDGMMTQRIDGLPNVVNDLAFSADGTRLAAVLWSGGLRLYAPDGDGRWQQLAADPDYGDASFGVAFVADGRLATASYDGKLRLYDRDGRRLLPPVATGHARPFGLAFNPRDDRLAVGFDDVPEVLIHDGATLAPLPRPDTGGLDNGGLSAVAWSADGATLFAAGSYADGGGSRLVVAWDGGGAGPRRLLPAAGNTVMSLRPLGDGALLVAAQDPRLGLLAADGTPRWTQGPKQIDPRGERHNLAVSPDGMLVQFGPTYRVEADRRRFDVAALQLLPPADDARVAPPVQDTLAIDGWINGTAPTLDGASLPLERYEFARSLAIHPDGGRFLLGTEWYLRAFDKAGAALWQRPAPGIAWAANISGDGRLAVAAYGDGTIRWHRMDDGAELLALFPLPDGEDWVVWTPEGVYAASPGAKSILRWHVNHGWNAAGETVPVWNIPETNRPEVISHVLPQLGTAGALAVAELAKIRNAVQRATCSDVAPGARLHVLAIGVSDYGPAASRLDLAYADRDARDVAAALRNSQSSLYAMVLVSELVNAEATRQDIIRELRAMREMMRAGDGNDLAVILFSGHGEMVDGDRFFLLPHGVDTGSIDALEDTALSSVRFHELVAGIAGHGRVILFLDACRSGGAVMPADRTLRAMLKAPNVTVFTSCLPGEVSVEDINWQNGAFTEALLEALRRDPKHDGLVRVSDLSGYLCDRVSQLTDGMQHPDVEIHFDARILVATG